MSEDALPPSVTVISFVDCINRRDIGRLEGLLTEDHALRVFDEEPLVGKRVNAEAWAGYFQSFPRYFIYPHRVVSDANRVAILGHTTGSHLGLPDDREAALTLIWVAETQGSLVRSWQLLEDSAINRRRFGLDDA